MKTKNWIQKAIPPSAKGALHKQLGVPVGEKIPEKKLNEAASGKLGPLAEKRANLAKTLKKMH